MSQPVYRNRLQHFIDEYQWTPSQAANALGVSLNTVKNLTERPHQSQLKAQVVGNICQALGVPVERVFWLEWIE